MKALIYDTETTGLPLFKEPSEDPRQPHIVQLGALLVDLDSREVMAEMDVIIRPEGWVIPPEMTAIHGITQEIALERGIPAPYVLRTFRELWIQADLRVAHNEQFDARIVRIAAMRHPDAGLDPDVWKAGQAECTQRLSTPILKLPPTDKMQKVGRFHFKSANLAEAYQHFMGQPIAGAHSAIADARACMAVYLAIKSSASAAA